MVHETTIEQIKNIGHQWQLLKTEVEKSIVGQHQIVDRIFIGLISNGHILLEGLPGLAKTTLVKTIAQAVGVDFSRIQFTPDLLPSDLVGTLIYNPKTQEFQTRKGPIFANLVLADEINRAPAKVQSALLEAMQEHQVTIGENTFKLDDPFLVLATQNPIEQEGTYRLPEAQVDRFMFKLLLTYPSMQEEKAVIQKVFNPHHTQQVMTKETILESRTLLNQVYVDDKVVDYILRLVFATRNTKDYHLAQLAPLIEHGASPRATLTLHLAARAHALLKRRHFVIPDDVKAIARDTLAHRILLTYAAEADHVSSSTIIEKIIEHIPSP